MRHDVATQLILTGGSGTWEFEYSRAIETHGERGLQAEWWVVSTDIDAGMTGTWSLLIRPQGSNDLSSWYYLNSAWLAADEATTLPKHDGAAASDPTTCAYVRLEYAFKYTSVTSGSRVSLKASIETFALS